MADQDEAHERHRDVSGSTTTMTSGAHLTSQELYACAAAARAQANALADEAERMHAAADAARLRELREDPAYRRTEKKRAARARRDAHAEVYGPDNGAGYLRATRHGEDTGPFGPAVRIGRGYTVELHPVQERRHDDANQWCLHEYGPRGGARDGYVSFKAADTTALAGFLRATADAYVESLHVADTCESRATCLPSGKEIRIVFNDRGMHVFERV